MQMGDVERINTGMRLTQATLARIDAAAARLGRSRAFVVEVLAYLHANGLAPDTLIPAGAVPADSRAPKQKRPRKPKR
jgi:hypothetical protein